MAVLLVIVSTNGTMDYNLLACDIFTGKFGAAKAGSNGTGLTKLGFSGEVSIVDGTGDALVKFGYLDDDFYFN